MISSSKVGVVKKGAAAVKNPAKIRTGILLVALLMLLSACASGSGSTRTSDQVTAGAAEQTGTPKRGGNLNVALHTDAVGLDPLTSAALTDRYIMRIIYDSLVTIDESLNINPGLAKSWDLPDDKTIVFHLQTGVKFHDGSDFNADVVKWNIERLKNKELGSLRTGELAAIDKVVVVDPNTVKFLLTAPAPSLLPNLADRPGYMVSPEAVKKWGKDYGLHPVGTGPFKFVDWQRDDHLTVERWDGYWREGLPYLDKITFKPIVDGSVRTANLKSGTMDMIYEIPPKDLASLSATPGITVINKPGLQFRFVLFNTTNPKLAKPEVRQALAMAIDRERLQKGVFLGTGGIAYGPLNPASWAYNPNFKPFTRDLDQAKKLLAQAGAADLSLELYTYNVPLWQQVAQAIQAQWAEIGVKASIKTAETGELINKMNRRDYDAMCIFYGQVDPDDNIFRFFASHGSYNAWTGFSNPEMERLLEGARSTYDQTKRADLYRQAQDLLAKDAPATYFHFIPQLIAYKHTVKGFTFVPDGLLRLETVWLDK